MLIADLAPRFHALFAGLDRAHGEYKVVETEPSGKRVGNNKSIRTVQTPATIEVWAGHLTGSGTPIGIVPIRDDATCMFGAVDIDDYGMDRKALVAKSSDLGFATIPCRTKSGGVHLYVFASEPVEAVLMRARLLELATALKLPKHEIFPKQEKLNGTDLGSWINMPYAGDLAEHRYALTLDDGAISAADFLDLAEAVRKPRSFFERSWEPESVPMNPTGEFADGPPCLQRMAEQGLFVEGTRNNLMFDVALYAGMKWPERNESREQLYQINLRIVTPPCSREETNNVWASANGKDYRYHCKKEPMQSLCDSKLCWIQPYGVGRSRKQKEGDEEVPESFPQLGQLRMYMSKPPVWYWDTPKGKTLQLTTDQLTNPVLFAKCCAEQLQTFPAVPGKVPWQKFVDKAIINSLRMEAPDDASEEGQIWSYLDKYCSRGMSQGQTMKELLVGKPFNDDTHTWFRMQDFVKVLKTNKIQSPLTAPNQLSALLHSRGVLTKFVVLDQETGKKAQIWGVPTFAGISSLAVPDSVGRDSRPY